MRLDPELRQVEGRRLVALVAELDCPGGEHVGLGELLRSLDLVFFDKSDQITQRVGNSDGVSDRPS